MAASASRCVSLRKYCSFTGENQTRCLTYLRIKINSMASASNANRRLFSLLGVDRRRLFSEKTSPRKVPVPTSRSVLERLHYVEESMRVKGYSVLRWGLGAIVIAVTTLYLFREEVRDNVADEVAVVATKSLGDENVVNKANEMTKIVLQDIINDPETSRLASNFVMSVLSRDDVRNAAIDLTLFVLKDSKTNHKVSELAASTLKDLLNKEDTKALLLDYIKALILDANTQQACSNMLKSLLEDPDLKAFMAESLAGLVVSSVVTNKAIELGKSVTHGVVSDESIRKETGDALWRVIKKTVTPSWFGNTDD